MRILLTNDDGVNATGIRRLYNALNGSHQVNIVAPAKERNASSHSITLRRPLKVKKLATNITSVQGLPSDCVILGVYELLKERPELIISGINSCPNLGDDVSYSGTVGAALEGAIIGIPSVAISFYNEGRDAYDFEAAIEFIHKIIESIQKGEWNKPCALNVNVPYVPKGIRVTKLGRRGYEDVVAKHRSGYLIGGTRKDFFELGTDISACKEGYISVTPLLLDLTNYAAIELFERIF